METDFTLPTPHDLKKFSTSELEAEFSKVVAKLIGCTGSVKVSAKISKIDFDPVVSAPEKVRLPVELSIRFSMNLNDIEIVEND